MSLLLYFGCGDRHHDGRLERVAETVSESPKEALLQLDSIDRNTLSNADRHYYDFLGIKAADKAYILHKSDSLILDVIDYASSHRNEGWYPEALYYGGRVYSDLGDYPTALRYFQETLDETSESTNLRLRSHVFSQMGRLLHEQRLYSKAVPYVEKSIEILKVLQDTFGLAYDNKLLSMIHINNKNYTKAERNNAEATKYAKYLSPSEIADMATDLASIYYAEGKIDSALQTIRPLPDLVDSLTRNYTLSVACDIYKEAGVLDTAYMYARELAMSRDPNNRKSGFRVIFSQEMRDFLPKDTLLYYMPIYKQVIEDYLDMHESTETLIQNANYNYQLHVRERDAAQTRSHHIAILLFIAIFIIVCLTGLVLYLRYRNIKQQIQLRNYLDIISDINRGKQNESNQDKESLKSRIFQELETLDKSTQLPEVSGLLLESKEYRQMSLLIKNGKEITDSQWECIGKIVEKNVPDFKSRLEILTNDRLTRGDYEIALLIRFGFTPSEMTVLLNRSKSAVSSRRSGLAKKIFESGSKIELLDKLILLL